MIKSNLLSAIAICFLLATGLNLSADRPITIIDIHGTEFGNMELTDNESIAEETNDVHQYDLEFNFAYPIKMNDKFSFIPRFDYETEQLRFYLDDKYLSNHLPKHFRSYFPGLATLANINEKWGFSTYIALGAENDYYETTTDDLRLKANFLINYNIQKDFQINFGACYDTFLGQPNYIPLLGIWWMPNASYYLNAILPEFIKFGYKPMEKLHLGLEGRIKGNFYRVSEDAEKSIIESGRVRERMYLAGVFSEFRVAQHLFIHAAGGMKFDQRLRFYDENNDELIFKGDLNNTYYLEFGLNWSIGGPFNYTE
jgi:hypothetical protein